MSLSAIVEHLYLPLLTQDMPVMIATFTYALKAGESAFLLVGVNSAAVLTDVLLFFVPAYVLSQRLDTMLDSRFRRHYDTAAHLVARFGTLRATIVMGFVMPSVAGMVCVGLLRLAFWRSLVGLLVGSILPVFIPLLIAAPLSRVLPTSLIRVLPWVAPAFALLFVTVYLARRRWSQPA